MYVLNSPKRSLAELRSYQDWYLKYALTAVDGVSEVASIGGFVRQYQIEVDPVKLRAYGVSLQKIKAAIQRSNNDVGGRVIEMAEREFMVRGLGYVKDVHDLEKVVLGVGPGGTPLLLRDVANVTIGPEIRRGLAEWNGEGETVAGVVVVRAGADTLATIDRVKDKLAELKAGPPGRRRRSRSPTTGRRSSIARSRRSRDTLVEESSSSRSSASSSCSTCARALVAILSIPVSILIAFIVMRWQGLGANIMSSVASPSPSACWSTPRSSWWRTPTSTTRSGAGKRSHFEIILRSAQEVGPDALLHAAGDHGLLRAGVHARRQEGRLFKPLAFTKTYALAASSLLVRDR